VANRFTDNAAYNGTPWSEQMKKSATFLIGCTALLLSFGSTSAQSQALSSTPAPKLLNPIPFLQGRDALAKKLLAKAPDDSLSPQLEAQLKTHINEVFDFAELSRLALGEHWETRTAEERKHFVETFSGIIQEQNFDSFLRYYREGQIDYQKEEVEGEKAAVTALVPLKREQIEIVYQLHIVDGGWRVYDLGIDGVSTAEGNRRRYARYIEKHSYEKLIAQLDKQLARLRESKD
jgi:phospholipid transport system substrate-binding protein